MLRPSRECIHAAARSRVHPSCGQVVRACVLRPSRKYIHAAATTRLHPCSGLIAGGASCHGSRQGPLYMDHIGLGTAFPRQLLQHKAKREAMKETKQEAMQEAMQAMQEAISPDPGRINGYAKLAAAAA